MTRREISSNVTPTEMARIVAALAAKLPPPEEVTPRAPAATLCRFARDTGELAFVNLPCRGNRIECRKTGGVSYAAACREGRCRRFAAPIGAENNQKV